MTSSSVSSRMTGRSRFATSEQLTSRQRVLPATKARQPAPLHSQNGRGRPWPLRHSSAVYSLTPPCTAATPPGCGSRLWLPSAGT
jgi:hypothetical protein